MLSHCTKGGYYTAGFLLLAAAISSAQPLILSDLVGEWQRQGGNGNFRIDTMGGNKLKLSGSTGVWQGTFETVTAKPPRVKLHFSRTPATAEMSADIPDWAKAIVQGKLEMKLELLVSRRPDGVWIEGEWDRGWVISKEVTEAGKVARTARVAAHGEKVEGE